MDYADTSALLKLVLPEPESPIIQNYVASAERVLISSLAVLEMRTQIRAFLLGGTLNRQQYPRIERYIAEMCQVEPFRFHELSGAVFRIALEQLVSVPGVHCRTLDRLHLAAMRELGATALVTFDQQQANAARALGFKVATF
jgi:predicted nucleic acid-binding protein